MIRLMMPMVEQRRLIFRFWQSASGYWRGASAWGSWSLSLLLVVTVCSQLAVQYRLNLWQRDFYDALQQRDEPAIWAHAIAFVGLAALSTILVITVTWGRMTAQRTWRSWLTEQMVAGWLASPQPTDAPETGKRLPSPEYRIAEDANVATQLPVDFAIGLLSSALGAMTFIGVLWHVGGDLEVSLDGGVVILPGYFVVAAVLYAMATTTGMLLVGRHLVPVVEEKNQAEAELRQAGTLLREISEGVRAISRQRTDSKAFDSALGRLNQAWRLVTRQLMATLFVAHGGSLVAPVVALALCVPKFLAGQLSLGEVMQLGAAFVLVQTAFGWVVDNYPRLAEWLSAVNRVALLLAALDEALARGSQMADAPVEVATAGPPPSSI